MMPPSAVLVTRRTAGFIRALSRTNRATEGSCSQRPSFPELPHPCHPSIPEDEGGRAVCNGRLLSRTFRQIRRIVRQPCRGPRRSRRQRLLHRRDRKSTRLNSSHVGSSYAV